jgi:divalent metal cation (Fe/Co/Zn/Cd) transporter
MSTSPTGLVPVLSDRARRAAVRSGVRIEVVTVIWMAAEAAVAIGAGVIARSVLLTAFGIDSVIELVTGTTLLWRLSVEARGGSLAGVERAENRAAWITGVALVALCVYVVAAAVLGLAFQNKPETSYAGVGLAVAAVVAMPVLAWRKRNIAARINSGALRADAACSITCAYLAGTLLVGLALNALFHWWWADGVAALALLYWLIPEAREALEGARSGVGACGCEDPDCGQ